MSGSNVNIDPTTTKYLIRASISAEGVIEKPDVVGAIFGQTEGLLGEDLDLRDLQKTGRIGRIEVIIDSKKGKSVGDIHLPSSLDKVETAILAAALESIDRVGPAKAEIKIRGIEDVRSVKRDAVIARARELLATMGEMGQGESASIMEAVRDSVRVEDMISFGPERLPAGPNVSKSDSIIVVEGRNDVANLLKNGIKNAIAVEGTNVPKTIIDLCKDKSVIAFVDGDRGGELILKELMQVAEIHFIARAPRANEVEELTQKQLIKALRNKIPANQFTELYSLDSGRARDTRDNPRGGDRRGRSDGRGHPADESEDEDEDVDLTSPIEGVDMTPHVTPQRPQRRPEQPRQEQRQERREERAPRDDERRGNRDEPRGRRDDRNERRDERPREAPRQEQREERREAPREERQERAPREERREAPREERQERAPREERRERREPRVAADEAPAAPAEAAPARAAGEKEAKFLTLLEELSGKLQAVMLNDAFERIGDKVAVRDLADTLKRDTPGVTMVVFDGVVTQRLIDIALDKKIATLVGVKTGNITKKPAGVEVVTRADLA